MEVHAHFWGPYFRKDEGQSESLKESNKYDWGSRKEPLKEG